MSAFLSLAPFVSLLPHRRPLSLVCLLDGGQQQRVNPGHPRVTPSLSLIHCCLEFLPASSPSFPPSASFHETYVRLFKSVLFRTIPVLLRLLVPLLPEKTKQKKTGWKTATTCCSQLLTMQIPSLSSSALPSHCPSFSLSLSATVGEELSHFLPFSSPSLLPFL